MIILNVHLDVVTLIIFLKIILNNIVQADLIQLAFCNDIPSFTLKCYRPDSLQANSLYDLHFK